ncbi:peptidoglycan DD-metalloendopeptidase family protein [Rhodoferax sp.]|uniref:peptidoglycan DD-metalloendopeptidase family protein n=1 Tax=Rhodoferax sp. TaxID=50421 RepID=UPI0027324FA8|nr:peptidoglycan DD-metalloendopeptidase family protein [Rhodoferax sp.]MDP3190534.1 peptidoglycan DD-metalloendopeptidase family protein [Rhodoferax sp.]MDP3338018.1 peptidoglycan DD-metalloendopeptidase family protein [Rhodoferax sp.]
MTVLKRRLGLSLAVTCVLLTLVACGSRSVNRAPVEERVTRAGDVIGVVPSVKPPQGFEHAGKPGYYTVKPGDTLTRIALENGQSPRDIALWSQVENPNRIEVGQVLRVVPPVSQEVQVQAVSRASVSTGTLAQPAAPAPALASTPAASETRPAPAAASESDINWIWPTNGPVLAGFDDVKNKGIDIGGTAGEPVLAAADGRVVYVGAGLRGYGNLIILKHNNVYLTAYAHNQTLLVKEDQSVVKGQKIAEMGNSDADRVKLHFEVRRQGKPVDPAKYLPAR